MNGSSSNDTAMCSRCELRPIEYKCEDCPFLCNSFCSICDTQVHTMIPEKKMHQRMKFASYLNNNSKYSKEYLNAVNAFEAINKENKTNEIEHLNKKIDILNDHKEFSKNMEEKNRKEKEELLNELNIMKKQNNLLVLKQNNAEKKIEELMKVLSEKDKSKRRRH